MEEKSLLIQSLDSVWFFSNVLSSSKTKTNVESSPSNTSEEEDPHKSMNPILQIQQNKSPNAEFETETEAVAEEANAAKKEERISRGKKRKSKRKILGEIDQSGFDDFGDNWGLNYDKITCGYGLFGSERHLVKMPSLSDGMAMKEHLKSWAYAVACSVR